jgi:MFS family permease
VKAHRPSKLPYYLLEGSNSFATAYYFNYLLFHLRDAFGFRNQDTLAVGAAHGFLYVIFSFFAGRFGQKKGYFNGLRIGFGGMFIGLVVGWIFQAWTMQLVALAIWTVTICFTWPVLEALVAEHEPAEQLPHKIGLYNVVWAGTAACGYFFGGGLFRVLGHASLYWLPAGICLLQWVATFGLQKKHDRWVAQTAADPQASLADPGEKPVNPQLFRKLAWLGNPMNYMAVNTLMVVTPGIATHAHLDLVQAGLVLGVWFWARTVGFAILWWWHGWHYRFSWFVLAFVLLLGSFFALLTSHVVWQLVVAQVGFGFASALLYYSSLFYAMDGSDTKAEHGGVHEALIGLGIFGGPAISTAAVAATGNPSAPAWSVGSVLLLGLATTLFLRKRYGQKV